MKTIGLLGGMSWESTQTYYRCINETINAALGGLHSAKILLYSVDFQEIETCQAKGDWDKSGQILSDAARALQRAGADFLVICTNTMHKVAPMIQDTCSLPLLHIAEATAHALHEQQIHTVGLLGTRYTMTQTFYRSVLEAQGITVHIPSETQIPEINRIIFEELCQGTLLPTSQKTYLSCIDDLAAQGAQGVILGCTEIGLLVSQEETTVPLFDTTLIHARAAAHAALVEDAFPHAVRA